MKLNLNKLIKKEILITSTVVLFLTLIFIGFTRAIYKTTSEGQTNTITYGNLEIQMCTDTSCANIASNLGKIVGMTNNVSFTANMYPKTEAEAISGTPYSFVVKNVGEMDAYADLISEYDWVSENPGSSLVTNYSGVMIAYKKAQDANYQIKELNQFTTATQLFKNVFLASGQSQIFHVWVWGNEEVSNEIINRIFITKIKVSGYYLPEDSNNLHNDLDNSLLNEETNHVDFAYTGNFQEFIAPRTGTYKIELWGAQGGASTAGKGAYTSGKIYLLQDTKLYIYVGQSLSTANSTSFNGGTANEGGHPGGGATDVRLTAGNWDDPYSLNSRIMVAAGSGAGSKNTTATSGAGGGLTGYAGFTGVITAGTQISAGTKNCCTLVSAFGIGNSGCAGGGGYYGGGGGACASGAAGGSSYISGHPGCIAINAENDINDQRTIKNGCTASSTSKACSVHYSGYSFNSTKMIDGAGYSWTTVKASTPGTMPSPSGGTEVGHAGNGYARITAIDDYVLDNSLVLHYDAIDNTLNGHSNSTTTWYDLSGNGRNGTLNNFGSTTTSGWQSNSLAFDGTDDKVSFSGEITNNYTISIIVKPVFTGTYPRIIGERPFPSIYLGSTSDYYTGYYGQNIDAYFTPYNILSTTKYSLIDLTYDGNNIKFYVNGVYKSSLATTTNATSVTTAYLGGRSTNDRQYRGTMSSVRIYSRALTDAEIQYNYAVDKNRFGLQ